MRIRFIVTGDLEKRAMVASVSRWFPPTTYEGEPIEWLPSRKVDAATTNRIVPGRQPGGAMRALAHAMVVEATTGKDGRPPDLVVVIDDVELHNLDQPDRVCATFRAAVEMRSTAARSARSPKNACASSFEDAVAFTCCARWSSPTSSVRRPRWCEPAARR